MAKRLSKSQSPYEKKCYSKDEEEIFNYDYEGISDTHPVSGISSSIKLPHLVDSSKENVELSLEVEIADSLKHLIASPEHINSDLLDVTIVRPTDLDFVRGLDISNTLAFTSSEVRNLIASMEREKQHKKKLIDECKKKAAASKVNTLNETHESVRNTKSKLTLARNEERQLYKRRLKRSENERCSRNNINVMSAPPECNLHVDCRFDKSNHTAAAEILKYKVGETYANSAPIAVLKPLVGEIKESLKHLEESISQIGDGSSNNNESKQYTNHFVPASKSNLSNDAIHYKHDENQAECQHTHQVYAAADNYNKLRKLLACQNLERRDEDNEKPCLCQHCGMIGLLFESQKRPIMFPTPEIKTDNGWSKNQSHAKTKTFDPEGRTTRKEIRSPHADRMKINDDNVWIIRDLTSRLEALELRVAAQEQRAVPKDYFKRIINKLWHRQNSDSLHTLQMNNQDRTQNFRNHSTQCSSENFENALKMKREPATVKHRNVQIQQNTKKNFSVHPVLLAEMNLEHPTQSTDSQAIRCNENVKAKTTNAIGDVFMKKTESTKRCAEANTSKEKLSAMQSFWRWGEEVIKPGFDLKIKIMSLLDEQFRNIKVTKDSDNKGVSSKRSEIKVNTPNSSLPKTSRNGISSSKSNSSKINSPNLGKINVTNPISLRQSNTTPDNIFEAPLPFEDKEISKNINETIKEENLTVPGSSSRTLKKMLDIMSAKIYNDHVKPTVEAIQQEQKSFNSENTKQIHGIKAAMDAALCKINIKQTPKTPNTYFATDNGREWWKDILEPLEAPTSTKNIDDDLNSYSKATRMSKKSAIPVRVANSPPTDSTSARNTKYIENRRSLIPCRKPPVKDWSDCITQNQDNKSERTKDRTHKSEKSQQRKASSRKRDTTPDLEKFKKDKNVHITYINPKVHSWNEESGASIQTGTSEEQRQLMLADKCHKYEKLRDGNTEEKRRFAYNHSLTAKLEFLTKHGKAEIGKTDIWNNILKEARNYCGSKQDTVIIQIPHDKHNGVGITEVEFTIEDLQKLVKASNRGDSGESPHEARTRVILEEVRKQTLGSCFHRK